MTLYSTQKFHGCTSTRCTHASYASAFSLKHPWASAEMLENPPVTNCGFVYLLFTCVVGLIGLILFSVAAKKYKYRQRDEGMFRQMDIEDVFEREIEQTSVNSVYS